MCNPLGREFRARRILPPRYDSKKSQHIEAPPRPTPPGRFRLGTLLPFLFPVNALSYSCRDDAGRNRFPLSRNKELRNGFGRTQYSQVLNLLIPSGIASVSFKSELIQGSLQDFVAYFVSALKLVLFRFRRAMQFSPDNLKKIGIALRLACRIFQSVGLNAVAHPFQRRPEGFAHRLSVKEPNADFVQAVPICGFDLVQAGRNIRSVGKNQQQWLTIANSACTS